MNDSQFNPQEQRLIDQLRSSPAPQMRPEAFERLRQQMFEEADRIWPEKTVEFPPPSGRRALPVLGLVAVLALLIAGAAFAVLSVIQDDDGPIEENIITTPTVTPTFTPTLTPTSTPTETPSPSPQPSSTLAATAEPTRILISTAAPTSTLISTADPTSTHTATTVPTLTYTSSPAPTTLLPTSLPAAPIDADDDDDEVRSVIVIEGTVAGMGQDYIVIFDLWIETDDVRETAVLLTLGTLVRVEGEARFEDGRIIVRAITLTIIPPATRVPQVQPQQPAPQQPPPGPPPGDPGRGSVSSRSS